VKSTFKLFVALCLLARPLLAADGVLIVENTTIGGKTQTNQIQIEKTRMRVESPGPTGATQVFVFDGGTQVLRVIDSEKKTYTEMTKADVDRMGTQMAGAMAQMQEQMKNLPPAQRAKMEAAMGTAAGAPAKTDYRKTGMDKVGKWTCDKYEGYQNQLKVADLCTVDPKAFGFAAADFQVTQQLGEFFRKMNPQSADQMFSLGRGDAQGFSGVPVRRTFAIAGHQIASEVTEVSRHTFADSIFAVPAGFQKQAFGAGR